MEKPKDQIDAGLASLDHYKIRLQPWRHRIRQSLLPIVRWETPYVALLQQKMRNPVLDTYFAWSANLGTHTAFMVVLPILFWCGHMSMGRGMVHILAAGVFLSGFVKDFLCLPRPLSPPLQRITMSGSAALEYGFPSTHSTNAVSVAHYALYLLRHGDSDMSPTTNTMLQILMYLYACSIILGRLYCGMHGFFDVIVGSALGAAIGAVQCHYGLLFDEWLYNSPAGYVAIVIVIILILVRVHPEPADNCPCFDDSVAFAAVMIGCEAASWHLATTRFSRSHTIYPQVLFGLETVGWTIMLLRIVVGISTVFAWRGIMKPFLLWFLPPVFRAIEQLGLDLPRRFFTPASQYKEVPKQRIEDNVIPSARDIPRLLSNLNRKRTVSVGPQSQADAIETLAMREKHRRDSITGATPAKEKSGQNGYFLHPGSAAKTTGSQTRRRSSSLDQFRAQMGSGLLSPVAVVTPLVEDELSDAEPESKGYVQEKELFANLMKPRVRYDVEVVTKLIVYAGIGWVAIEMNPILFHLIGLV